MLFFMSILTVDDLSEITSRTIDHYNLRAQGFRQGTIEHDVSQNINTLVEFIQGESPFRILDFGCGPGRDLLAFKKLGHDAIGIDGAEEFCEMARQYSKCEVLHQDFLELHLPEDSFDGVFANAALFHIPFQELPRVLVQLASTLKKHGVLFSSNPHGPNIEGWSGDRYSSYHDWEAWKTFVTQAGFEELTHYYRPTGLPRDQQPWLASAWRKVS